MSFLLTFLIHLILATQSSSPLFVLPKHLSSETMDDESVEEIFDKTLGKSELAQGWLVLLRGVSEAKVEKAMEGMGKGRREGEVVRRGLGIAREVLGWVV